jgi:phenylpropionate dioxygenase-like ring-hydroxylating dioxygenase large terminal subunit
MTFLKNAWYVAAFAEELAAEPLFRRLLDEQVCLFRGESGAAHAVGDVCPHRFAPLHEGKVVGETIQCPYHGLRFDGSGACAHNPHGDGRVPTAAKVAGYPVVERHSAIWIWMGDAARADPALIPDFSILDQEDRFVFIRLHLHSDGAYQLISDNLLDLSHVEFLHPFLANQTNPGEPHFEMTSDETSVTSTYVTTGADKTGLYEATWPEGPERIDTLSIIKWQAPSFCFGHMRARPAGANDWAEESYGPNMHMITPETASTAHYFWAGGYRRDLESAEFTEQFRANAEAIFVGEDLRIIAAAQTNMGTDDLLGLKPVILGVDAAAVRARRILDGLIKAEAGL